MTTFLRAFAADESGATAIEYGMIAMFIALAVVTVVQMLGADVLSELYDKIAAATEAGAQVGN